MEIVNLVAIVVFFAVAAYLYPLLPARVATHWDINGQVNGYMGRFWGAFFVPVLTLGSNILFLFIPRIDPKKENNEKFRKSFDVFVSLFLIFMFYIYALAIFWAFGHVFNMNRLMIPAFAFPLIIIIYSYFEFIKSPRP